MGEEEFFSTPDSKDEGQKAQEQEAQAKRELILIRDGATALRNAVRHKNQEFFETGLRYWADCGIDISSTELLKDLVLIIRFLNGQINDIHTVYGAIDSIEGRLSKKWEQKWGHLY